MTVLDLTKNNYYFVIERDMIWGTRYMGACGSDESGDHLFSASIPNDFCNRLIYVESWEIEYRVFKIDDKLKAYMELFEVLREEAK